ncbi:hypothetical protein [Thalassovita sp.]|uniref:hypothetical protein n=1 Tax=Thalassovita sp. TaxID=1979401 RepID=UPI002B268490|nr:hypothetical protein [Thalassovita sp.]
MIERVTGAASRAFFMALLVAMPSMFFPETTGDATALVALVAMLAAIMTFFEYFAEYPSVLEFRDAAPFNRFRFVTVFLVVLVLGVVLHDPGRSSELVQVVTALARFGGDLADFPYSPVRLVLLTLPTDVPATAVENLRIAAAMAYVISGLAVLGFFALVQLSNWPMGNGAFNVWVNLPMFDPTKGDVLIRLTRDARINVMLGFILPFLIPAVIKGTSGWIDPRTLMGPQTMIWSMTVWASLPATLMMRGIALGRIAEMIGEKRRRAYAEANLHTV